jgi:hypothetical protein
MTSESPEDAMPEEQENPPELPQRARGWLRYVYRKAVVDDDWSKTGHPSEMWDDKTGPPTSNFHRFDAFFSSFAIALMSDMTPAWREVYSLILDRLVDRITSYWGAIDWTEQIGHDPKRRDYPNWYFPTLIPFKLRGEYDTPGWAGNGVEPWGYEPDPVKAAGAIYYKGFLSLAMGLHLYASGDRKYDDGFTIVNNGEHTFHYTHRLLNERISEQWSRRAVGSH